MFDHLRALQTALPPPRRARTRAAPWRTFDPVDLVTAVVGTLVVVALGMVSALTLLAATPAGLAVPATMLFIGALIAGGVAIRSRAARAHRALVRVVRPTAAADVSALRAPRVRSARADRSMLLQAGRGESWRPRR